MKLLLLTANVYYLKKYPTTCTEKFQLWNHLISWRDHSLRCCVTIIPGLSLGFEAVLNHNIMMGDMIRAVLFMLFIFGPEETSSVEHGYHPWQFAEELLKAERFTMVLTQALGASSITGGQRSSRSPGLECSNKLDDRSCDYLRSLGYCNSRRQSMGKFCRRSCRICVDPPCHLSRYGCCFDNKTIARGPNMLGCNDDCRDRSDKRFCKILKRNGECYKDHENARRQCAVTCGYCRPCEDLDPQACQLALVFGGCSQRKGKMANICRKTCKLCGKKDPCIKFLCPKGSVCEVDEKLRPFCKCDGKCKRGDYYTGILCGRDGVEYKNLCELKKRNCGHPEMSQITVKKFGRCQDAIVASDKQALCKRVKREPPLCQSWASKGYCSSHRSSMLSLCPKSCNLCAAQQAAKPSCHYTKFGCCLDNKTICRGTDYRGCPKYPACRDFSAVFCKRFIPLCGVKNHQDRMARFCGKSCNVCV